MSGTQLSERIAAGLGPLSDPRHPSPLIRYGSPAGCMRFAKLVSGHRSVEENRCHWVLDVTFGGDYWQIREQTAVHNFSIVLELTLKVLRDHPGKLSLRRKRAEPPSIQTSASKSSALFMRKP